MPNIISDFQLCVFAKKDKSLDQRMNIFIKDAPGTQNGQFILVKAFMIVLNLIKRAFVKTHPDPTTLLAIKYLPLFLFLYKIYLVMVKVPIFYFKHANPCFWRKYQHIWL